MSISDSIRESTYLYTCRVSYRPFSLLSKFGHLFFPCYARQVPEYEFFVSSEAPRPANKAMRSHAMKIALASRSRKLRNPEEEEIAPGQGDSLRTEQLKDVLKGRFRVSNHPKTEKRGRPRKRPVSIITQALDVVTDEDRTQISRLGSESLDPFDVLPVANNWRVDSLIKYCMDVTSSLVLCRLQYVD